VAKWRGRLEKKRNDVLPSQRKKHITHIAAMDRDGVTANREIPLGVSQRFEKTLNKNRNEKQRGGENTGGLKRKKNATFETKKEQD